jgi:hypothetical protein
MTQADGSALAGDELERLAERVDAEVEAVDELDAAGRERAIALKRAVEAFHRAGLVTIVRRLKADPRGLELLLELLAEPAVRALLAMHGIVRTAASAAAGEPHDLVQIRLPVMAEGR